jgi:hypothetical protein
VSYVIGTLITGAFGLLAALVERGRRQNSREHGDTMHRVDRVLEQLGRVEHKIDAHVETHGSTENE